MERKIISLLFASAVGFVFAGDPLGAIAPFRINFGKDLDKLESRLLEANRLSGICEFALVGTLLDSWVTGAADVAAYEKCGRDLAEMRRRLGPKGITCGFWMLPTMNVGLGHAGYPCIWEDGSERKITGCQICPEFREDQVAKVVAIARFARPERIMLEDDYRYFGLGCFCPKHLEAYGKRTGVRRTREQLVVELKSSDKGTDALRLDWHRFQMEGLETLGAEMAAAVHAVSPGTRIGICAPGGIPLPDTMRMARIVAGGKRPWVRWYGCFYDVDHPVWSASVLFPAQWAYEHLNDGHEMLYEGDLVPHNTFYSSAARSQGLISSVLFMGCDKPWFFAIGSGPDDFNTSPDYMIAYKREVGRMVEVRDCGKRGRPVGLQVCFDPWLTFRKEEGGGYTTPDEWYAVLNRMGVPVTTTEQPVKLYAGRNAFSAVDNAALTNVLSGRVFLDGPAAEAVIARGCGGLIGLRADRPRGIDFTGECETRADGWTAGHTECLLHQPFGLDNDAFVSSLALDGADEITYYYAGNCRNRIRPSITRFENAAGGRVAVIAMALANIKSSNVFCFPKKNLLIEQFGWLGGDDAVPVYAKDRANTYVLAREDVDEKTLYVHAMNLSCDTRDSYAFGVAPRFARSRVMLLDDATWRDAGAEWSEDGRTFRISDDVPVFKTMIFKVLSRSGDVASDEVSAASESTGRRSRRE